MLSFPLNPSLQRIRQIQVEEQAAFETLDPHTIKVIENRQNERTLKGERSRRGHSPCMQSGVLGRALEPKN